MRGKVSRVRHMDPGGSRESRPKRKVRFADQPDNDARAIAISWTYAGKYEARGHLGRGASGKSRLARCLGDITQLPVIELDKVFWRPGLAATPCDQWVIVQEKLVAEDGWIMDCGLGPHDVLEGRPRAADTVIFLSFSFLF